jgi:hypothetical protein
MKLTAFGVAIGLAVASLVVTTGSCSINHRSQDYACTKQSDCSTGRSCMDGFCVTQVLPPDGSQKDAPNNTCPPGCTTCNVAMKTCDINCQTSDCNGQVACPMGYHCTIECDTHNACDSGVNCRNAASCTIACSGQSSCRGIECGSGPCDVVCTGADSCQNITCGNSCACDVVCTDMTSCASGITCTSIACRNGSGCSSVQAFCHTC